jgi:hypothetical protein
LPGIIHFGSARLCYRTQLPTPAAPNVFRAFHLSLFQQDPETQSLLCWRMVIVNPEPAVLDKLVKEGKKVQIEGRLTIGADQLFIEKINGKQSSPEKQK